LMGDHVRRFGAT